MVKYDLDITCLYSLTLDKTLSHAHEDKLHRRSHSTHTRTHDTLPHHTVTLLHTRSHTGQVRGCLLVSRPDAHRRGQRSILRAANVQRISLCVFTEVNNLCSSLSPKVVILLHHSLIYTSKFCSDLNRNAAYSCSSSLFFYKPNPFNLSCFISFNPPYSKEQKCHNISIVSLSWQSD